MTEETEIIRDRFDPCSGSESEADSPKSNRSRSNGKWKSEADLRSVAPSAVTIAAGGR